MKFIFSYIIILFVLVNSIFGQQKVGTSPDTFIEEVSLRFNGMGQSSVALADHASFIYNPGSVGLYGIEEKVSITPFINRRRFTQFDDLSYLTITGGTKLLRVSRDLSSFSVGMGFYQAKQVFELVEINYGGDSTGNVFRFEGLNQKYALSIGYDGLLQIGAGISFNHYQETVNDNKYSDWTYTAGIILQKHLIQYTNYHHNTNIQPVFTPSIGFAYFHLGTQLPTRKGWRAGGAITTGFIYWSSDYNWNLVTLIPVVEIERPKYGEDKVKYGVELGMVEAFYVRIGGIDGNEPATWGFTVNTLGIFKALLRNTSTKMNMLKYLATNLTVGYTEARNDNELFGTSGLVSRGIIITFSLPSSN